MLFFHDNNEVLLCQIYDLQMTWCYLYFQSKQEAHIQHILAQNV